MRELDRRIATLRLRLAEVRSRQEQLQTLQTQFQNQLHSIVDFAAMENGDLDSALSMAGEVDSRLNQTNRTLELLAAIRGRGEEELETLLLTRSIDMARAELAEWETRLQQVRVEMESIEQAAPPRGASASDLRDEREGLRSRQAETEAQIRRLRQKIEDVSEEAARAVSTRGHRGNVQEGAGYP